VPVTEMKLCTGTEKLLAAGPCTVTTTIGDLIAPPGKQEGLDYLLSRLRFGAMILGVIQFGTLLIFVYTVAEMIGLRWRWVRPKDILFDVTFTDAGARLMPKEDLNKEITRLNQRRVHGIGDRLYRRGIAAGLGDESWERSSETSDIVETVESYRVFLLDDAIARQDFLETLGDTMLKLAFLGTIYGISSSLFSARGLDTADPIVKLLAKADMYAGIGLGFGATFVGIVFSIIAAQMRTNLGAAWAGRIATAYRLILDFGAPAILHQSASISPDGRKQLPGIPLPSPPVNEWSVLHRFGGLVLVIILIFIAFRFRDTLAQLPLLVMRLVGQ